MRANGFIRLSGYVRATRAWGSAGDFPDTRSSSHRANEACMAPLRLCSLCGEVISHVHLEKY